MKVNGAFAAGLICLLVGIGMGVVGMEVFKGGEQATAAKAPDSATPTPVMTSPPPGSQQPSAGPPGGMGAPGGMGGMPGGAPGGMGGAPGGAPGGKGGKGGFGPSPKVQLASLVAKLELVTGKPVSITLSDEQKKKVAEKVAGLEAQAELSDDDAKARLDNLIDTLKDHKDALESVGYRWPGQPFARPADTPNPFKDEKNAAALKSLQSRLGAK